MSDQDAFERILASLYDAMLDDTRWPATSALIDEACGLTGNALLVGEGPKNDIQILFVGLYYRGHRRTRIFLSLSDDASAKIASELCGQVVKIKASWTVTESAGQAQVSLMSGQAGGSQGSVGTSKSFREQREALFQPREFGLLPNCQAICLPYDGASSTSAVRVYLKPYYLPPDRPYWRAVEAGQI